jgi:uncharacterized lipoprotein YajG
MGFRMKSISCLFALIFAVGCAHVNSVSLTPIPAERSNQVQVIKDKVIFLGFNFDNDFVDSAVEDLKRQCPNGKVTGLLTKDETINYFLFFVWKKQLTAKGFCVKNNDVSAQKKKSRGTASDEDQSPTEEDL